MTRDSLRLLVAPGLLLAAAVGLLAAVALPSRADLIKLRSQLARERGRLEVSQNVPAVEAARREAELRRQRAEAALASSTLPSGQELELITSLERLAGRHRVVQDGIQLSDHEATGVPGWTVTSISLELSGTFPQLVAYLRDLERSPYLVAVEGVRLSGADRIRASLRGRVLWRPAN